MLRNINYSFNSFDFQKKLRHYFLDSSPVLVDLDFGVDSVTVTEVNTNNQVTVIIPCGTTVKVAVRKVIETCENSIYPIFMKEKITNSEISKEERLSLLMKGMSLQQINAKKFSKTYEKFILVRVSKISMSAVFLNEEKTTRIFASFEKPMFRVLDELNELNPVDRYTYLIDNSELKEYPFTEKEEK
ncbi:MAG: hypothetical protein ACRCZB_05350 [Bacteroidales bacterium]